MTERTNYGMQTERPGEEINREIERLTKILGLKKKTYALSIGKHVVRFNVLHKSNVNIERHLPKSVANEILKYAENEVREETQNVGRSDCANVAGTATRKLKTDSTFHIGTIGTLLHSTPIKAFRQFGYNHHIINFLEKDTLFLALDLTASYTMDVDQGNYHVFGVAGKNEDEVLEIMKNLTGTKWEVR